LLARGVESVEVGLSECHVNILGWIPSSQIRRQA
jgi:hypothetical protein